MRKLKTLLPLLGLLVPISCSAAKARPIYQEAVLVSFKTVSDGLSCSTSTSGSATANQSGSSYSGTSNSSSSCTNTTSREYTVRIGKQIMVLTPTVSGKRIAASSALVIGTLGYGALFLRRHDVLWNSLPNTPIHVRAVGNGINIKLGKKESLYSIVAAQ